MGWNVLWCKLAEWSASASASAARYIEYSTVQYSTTTSYIGRIWLLLYIQKNCNVM